MNTRPRPQAQQRPASALDAAIEATEEIQVYGTKEKISLSMEEVRLLIAIPTRTGKLPSDREIILFQKTCKARGLNPYAKDAFLVGYDGKDGAKFETIVSLQAVLKRCEGNKDYEGKEYGVLVWDAADKKVVEIQGDCVPKDMPVVGGWCRIYRKGKRPEYATATMKAYAKQFGHWAVDPHWMIAKCAIAKACRQAYPSDVGDLTIQEEMGAIMERTEAAPVARQRSNASLNARLAAQVMPTVEEVLGPADDDHGDAWEPSDEERDLIEQQLFDTHENAAEA